MNASGRMGIPTATKTKTKMRLNHTSRSILINAGIAVNARSVSCSQRTRANAYVQEHRQKLGSNSGAIFRINPKVSPADARLPQEDA